MFERQRLSDVLRSLGVDAGELFDALDRAYGEPSRHYHNRVHIAECLTALDTFVAHADRPAEVEVAIWFHDAVYDSQTSDNEERSAEWAREFLTRGDADADVVARISDLVMATKAHVADDADSRLIVDLDLAILAADPERFEEYDRAIRAEYAWVSEDQYRAGRRRVLESFLERPEIYQVDEIRTRLEPAARRNLAAKIDSLAAT